MVSDQSGSKDTIMLEAYGKNSKHTCADSLAEPDSAGRHAERMVQENTNLPPRRDREPMVRAKLMGSHSHAAADGTLVHVWRRGTKYLARGSLSGLRFGETIGEAIL